MHILVLGGGGREHALVKALRASSSVKHLSCAPGNPGIAKDATCYLTDPTEPRKVLELAQRLKPDLVVVGPEVPLAVGVSDALRQMHFTVFGPSQNAAKLETSKVFSKQFMVRHKIPTGEFIICSSKDEVIENRKKFAKPWVIKADGLAAGKGVRVCESEPEFNRCLDDFFESKTLGQAAEKVVVEEFIEGEELSLIALIAGDRYSLLPVSQDYKRLLDKDKGPNTGGMGAYAPVKGWTKELKSIEEKIVIPTIEGLKKEGMDYRGALYFGLMMRNKKPFVLEYNVRFGDPEAQVLLPLLDGDWAEVLNEVALGRAPKLNWKKLFAVCVVVTSPGYPDAPKKGLRITLDKEICKPTPSTYILHASTSSHQGYFTNGGRVLNSVAIDKSLPAARIKAYETIKGVTFLEMHYRKDIADISRD